MLPGGLSVLGVFIITDSSYIDIIAPLQLVSQIPTYKTVTVPVVVEMLQEYSTDWHIGLGKEKANVKWFLAC